MSPYTLPEGNVQIAFSGGRTSAYMLHQILEANGPLPERVVVSFQNTGREMPETLDFVQECSVRWDVPVVWLEYRPTEPRFEVVNHNSASRDGEPFAMLIEKRKGLPYKFARFCTAELKVHTVTRFAKSLGWEKWWSAIGIRADEPRRLGGKTDARERFTHWYPLAKAGVGRSDVSKFWAKQPFDLQLINVNGRTPLGNCDGCFLKSEANRAALARDYPERFAWWIEMEEKAKQAGWGGKNTVFNVNATYRQLADYVSRQGTMFDDFAEYCQADDGECTG